MFTPTIPLLLGIMTSSIYWSCFDLFHQTCVSHIICWKSSTIKVKTSSITDRVLIFSTKLAVVKYSAENPVVSRVLSLQAEVDQNVTLHAPTTARNSAFLISAFLVHSTSFSPILFQHSEVWDNQLIRLLLVFWWIVFHLDVLFSVKWMSKTKYLLT